MTTTFSNSANDPPAAVAAYVSALLALLGGRDPFEVQGELPSWLEARLAGIDETRLRTPEAPGKWSAIEVLAHLADTEVVFAYRTRMILAHDRPPIQGYDQDAWAERLGYRRMALDVVLGALRAQRIANLALWTRLDAAELAREGLHAERGAESIAHIMRLIAAHDLVHRAQIDRILAAI